MEDLDELEAAAMDVARLLESLSVVGADPLRARLLRAVAVLLGEIARARDEAPVWSFRSARWLLEQLGQELDRLVVVPGSRQGLCRVRRWCAAAQAAVAP